MSRFLDRPVDASARHAGRATLPRRFRTAVLEAARPSSLAPASAQSLGRAVTDVVDLLATSRRVPRGAAPGAVE